MLKIVSYTSKSFKQSFINEKYENLINHWLRSFISVHTLSRNIYMFIQGLLDHGQTFSDFMIKSTCSRKILIGFEL